MEQASASGYLGYTHFYSYKIVFVKLQCKKCCKRLLLSRCDENKNLLAVNLHVLITNELHDFQKEKLMQTSRFRHNYCMILHFLVILHRIFGRAIPSSLKSDTLLINITELSIKKYVSAIFSEPQIIHSKDKIYLKDEATGQYICVLQKGVGIIYLEDNAGHTWNALWYCVFCVT